ncbi:MAG: hypothetical protein ABI330_09090 [Caldimonas sp.]
MTVDRGLLRIDLRLCLRFRGHQRLSRGAGVEVDQLDQSETSMPVVIESGKSHCTWIPSSRPGYVDDTVFWPIEPPEQPLPIVYLRPAKQRRTLRKSVV